MDWDSDISFVRAIWCVLFGGDRSRFVLDCIAFLRLFHNEVAIYK